SASSRRGRTGFRRVAIRRDTRRMPPDDRAGGYRRAALRDLVIEPGRARATVDPADALALCEGHFPDDPFVPGAYLLGILVALADELLATRAPPRRAPCRVEHCFFLDVVPPTRAIAVEARIAGEDERGVRV